MAMDIDQLDAIIDKFMDYARPGEVELVPVRRRDDRRRARRRRSATPSQIRIHLDGRARHRACWPTRSSSAACSRTCSRTRAATAARPTPASPRVVVSYARTGPWVIITRARPRPGRRSEEARPADHAVLPRRCGAHRRDRRRPRAGDRREGGAAHGRHVRAGQRQPDGGLLAHIRLQKARAPSTVAQPEPSPEPAYFGATNDA